MMISLMMTSSMLTSMTPTMSTSPTIQRVSPEYKVMFPLMSLSLLTLVNPPPPHRLCMAHSERLSAWLLLGKDMYCTKVRPPITTCIHTPLHQVAVPARGEPQAHRDRVRDRSLMSLECKVMRPSLPVSTCLPEAKLILGTIPLPSMAYRDRDQ